MAHKPIRAVLDANVLYPFSLRDTLLRAADAGMFQLYWSEEILDETIRNLISNAGMNEAKATHLRSRMEEAFPEAMVTGYEILIDEMRNDPKDRHVAAVAVHVGAEIIVTENLGDFVDLPKDVDALSPDGFLCDLFEQRPAAMVALLRRQAAALRNPPRTFEDLLRGLGKTVPKFAESVAGSASLE